MHRKERCIVVQQKAKRGLTRENFRKDCCIVVQQKAKRGLSRENFG